MMPKSFFLNKKMPVVQNYKLSKTKYTWVNRGHTAMPTDYFKVE